MGIFQRYNTFFQKMLIKNVLEKRFSVSWIIYFEDDYANVLENISDSENEEEDEEEFSIFFQRTPKSRFHKSCIYTRTSLNSKVNFAEKIKVCPLHLWSYAFRKYRLEGRVWMIEARDRMRFKNKVRNVYEPLLTQVLISKLKRINTTV